ncbi:hypothetical protein B0H13DRAFT_2356491 [Mycena leptocephala]|nr:hypothetical protein B0H13DRAFT_2356491 [Mycena leptocephala]
MSICTTFVSRSKPTLPAWQARPTTRHTEGKLFNACVANVARSSPSYLAPNRDATMAGRQTRSGAEFSPFVFENAVPYRTDRISLRELLVRRAEDPDSDSESLAGSEDSDDTADESSGPIFTETMHRTSAAAASNTRAPPPSPTFTHWITPRVPPPPKPFLATATGICCAPSHPKKSQRSQVEERQRVKKRSRDRRVRREHREERRIKAGSRLKGVTQLHVRQSVPDEPDPRAYGLEELREIDPDFTVYNWNGIPQPVLDHEDRVLLVLGGFPPNAPDWKQDVADAAAKEMESAAKEIYTESKWRRKLNANADKTPCRGPHAAESVGPSMGGGQPYPMMLRHSVTNAAILAGLFGRKCFERIAGWTNVLFMGFAPVLHEYYRQTIDDLFEWDAAKCDLLPLLRHLFSDTNLPNREAPPLREAPPHRTRHNRSVGAQHL